MTTLYCPEGHEVTGLPFGVRNAVCEVHEVPLLTSMQVKKGKGMKRSGGSLKRSQRRESKAEKAARDHFNEVVKARPCFFRGRRDCWGCRGRKWVTRPVNQGGDVVNYAATCPACLGTGEHACSGPKDAHHLIPKQFIRRRLSDWPEDKLLAVLFNPLIGAPLCRCAHDAVERGSDRIYWEDLTDECKEYVGSLPDFMLLRLESECPKRDPIEHSEQGEAAHA